MKKNILKTVSIVLGVVILGVVLVFSFLYFGLKDIPESHIEGNVPDKEVFDKYLSRDLNIYFTQKLNKEVGISYELLRESPIQVGVGAPKFYAWVVVKDSSSAKILQQGAVRVGANAKESFTVMNFVPQEEIINRSQILEEIFPSDVVFKIKKRL